MFPFADVGVYKYYVSSLHTEIAYPMGFLCQIGRSESGDGCCSEAGEFEKLDLDKVLLKNFEKYSHRRNITWSVRKALKMVVRFLFKQVIPSAVLYYGGIQMYLVYHLYSSEGMVRTPKATPIYPQEPRRKLVKDILSIYQCKATHQSFLNFAKDVQFEDPGGYLEGIDSVRNSAFLMRSALKAETLSLKEHHYQDQFILELKQKYTVLGFQLTLPSVVYVELEGQLEGKSRQEKVKRFHEEWYGKTLITPENSPFAFTGVTSHFFRGIHGRLFNIMKFEPNE